MGGGLKMDKLLIESLIKDDEQNLLDIDKKGVYRIYGRIKGRRGGAFFGFNKNGEPIFGGGNLIHAPMWWSHTWREVSKFCDEITARYPACIAIPDKCD